MRTETRKYTNPPRLFQLRATLQFQIIYKKLNVRLIFFKHSKKKFYRRLCTRQRIPFSAFYSTVRSYFGCTRVRNISQSYSLGARIPRAYSKRIQVNLTKIPRRSRCASQLCSKGSNSSILTHHKKIVKPCVHLVPSSMLIN